MYCTFYGVVCFALSKCTHQFSGSYTFTGETSEKFLASTRPLVFLRYTDGLYASRYVCLCVCVYWLSFIYIREIAMSYSACEFMKRVTIKYPEELLRTELGNVFITLSAKMLFLMSLVDIMHVL